MKMALRRTALALMGIALAFMLYSCGGGDTPGGDPGTCEHAESRMANENEHPATCTEQGAYDEVVYCVGCNMEMGREKKFVSALGHDELSHTGKAPGCLEDGYGDYVTCSRCEYTTYAKIDAMGHNAVHHDAKKETCTEIGWYDYETCENCDYTTYA